MPSRLLTSSRLKAARACQRLHLFEYELGYRPAETEGALRFGTLLHKGLEAWWRGLTSGYEVALAAALEAVASEEADAFDRVRAEEMLRGYHCRWVEEPYKVLAVEAEFETELRNPTTGQPSRTWRLAGKVDAVVMDLRDGLVRVVEHKTSSEDITPGSEYWRRLRMDGQVSVYFEGAKSLGHEVSGCLYDVLGKPGIRPLKATPPDARKYKKDGTLYAGQREVDETPEEFRARLVETIAESPARFYQRGEVVRLEAEMDEALFDVWQLGQQIREAELAQRAPRNPDACVRYGRTCPFFDVCTGAASLDGGGFIRRENVHPELQVSKEEAA
jgi:hypothetical protein